MCEVLAKSNRRFISRGGVGVNRPIPHAHDSFCLHDGLSMTLPYGGSSVMLHVCDKTLCGEISRLFEHTWPVVMEGNAAEMTTIKPFNKNDFEID